MTDNEIIKALKCCGRKHNEKNDTHCKNCQFKSYLPCVAFLCDRTTDIINRQKVEIERSQKTGEEAVNFFTRMETLYKIKCKDLEVAKLEAYREFAELVKLEFYKEFDELIPSIMADKIDNLVKELKEKNDFKE